MTFCVTTRRVKVAFARVTCDGTCGMGCAVGEGMNESTMNGYETIEMAMARAETPEEKKRAREERKASMVAVRRRKAAEAFAKLPGCKGLSCPIADSATYSASDIEMVLPEARRVARTLAATDEHEVAARLALDALGALWAVL